MVLNLHLKSYLKEEQLFGVQIFFLLLEIGFFARVEWLVCKVRRQSYLSWAFIPMSNTFRV